jgi:hypothetical protein
MTAGTTPRFEIPADMRKMAEQSAEQVKTAINAYLDFCKRSVPENVLGGSALSNKIFGYAEVNLAKASNLWSGSHRFGTLKNSPSCKWTSFRTKCRA